MVLTIRALYRNCNHIRINITKPVRKYATDVKTMKLLGSNITKYNGSPYEKITQCSFIRPDVITLRKYCVDHGCSKETPPAPEQKKGILQKFKEMYRDYWYVLVPVHIATSAVWLGGFYYMVKSGVDVIGILQSIGLSESIIIHLKNSNAGYFALTFALYKLAGPLRYAVTLGGTTYAIRRLTALGWIKPVPSRERLKEMIQEQKGNIQERINEGKAQYTHMKEKRSQLVEEMRRYKNEMQMFKSKIKKM